jgi:hypothetical protein
VDELAKVREDLWSAVGGVSDDLLRRPNNDGWSILHVLEHLYLVEKSTIVQIKRALACPPVTEQFQNKNLERALDRTIKVKAPKSVNPKGIFQSIDDARHLLSQSRQELVSLISATDAEDLQTHGARHPVFGILSLEQWVKVLALHERRHIAQIEELKESLQ